MTRGEFECHRHHEVGPLNAFASPFRLGSQHLAEASDI